jgi:hypothetical protein
MLISKFGGDYTPDRAATHWKFVSVIGDSDPKYLSWTKTQFNGMKFIWRNFGYEPGKLMEDPVTKEKDMTLNILRKYAAHRDYGVVFQVLNWKGGQHWLAAEGKAILGWAANDPATGNRLWCAPLPYKRIIGWGLMKRA